MSPDGTVNWAYIFATLSIRFVGVFILLGILYIGISIASKIIAMIVSAKQTTKPTLK